MTKQIELTKGYFATVDDENYEKLMKHSWYALVQEGGVYAVSRIKYVLTRMHRFILPCDSSLEVDHIDGNGLNNQLSNLRVVTRNQNMYNSKHRAHSQQAYKGIKAHGRGWMARIVKNKSEIYLGTFDSPEDAAHAYDAKAVELFGEFARLNFPNEGNQ